MPTIEIRCKAAKTLSYRELTPLQGDLKKITRDNLDRLKLEIRSRGFLAPLFVWESPRGIHYTLDGHQRCKALEELEREGYTIPPVPVAMILCKDLKTARRALLGIVSQFGEVTDTGLIGYIHEAEISLDDLVSLRMPEVDIAKLLEQLSKQEVAGAVGADEIPTQPNPTQPKTKPGQIFSLGGHRLMCGDSTSWDDIGRLMGRERARMVFTDPPYGVSYTGVNNPEGHEWERIKNDDLRGAKLQRFLEEAFACVARATIVNPAVYVFHASANQRQFEEALVRAGFRVKQQIIWNKGMILSHSDYHWAHEPIFYAIKDGKNCEWFSGRTSRTVYNMQPPDLAAMTKDQLLEVLQAAAAGTTNWEYKRDAVQKYVHPTQKPVDLICHAVRNSSAKGEIVLDPFGGSGSTLIACDIMERRCFTAELDEKYCDVIIDRWQQRTKQKAKLIKT